MDIFQHRYYRLTKILMSLIGIWPYQRIYARRGILATVILFIAYDIRGQIQATVKYRDDWDILEYVLPIAFNSLCVAKYINLTWNSPKILKLLDRIRKDWKVWAQHQEVKILHEYAERGGNINSVYAGISSIVKDRSNLTYIHLLTLRTAAFYSVTFFFKIQPIITKLSDIVLNNGTEPGKFSTPVVYEHVDVQKYYYYLVVYGALVALIFLTALVSSELMLILYVQHVCGISAAVGHKLELIGSKDTSIKLGESPHAPDKMDNVYLASCIDRHNDALEYADLINATYVWDLFFTIISGMIIIITTGLQIFLRIDDLGATLTFVSLTLGTALTFYAECCISQMLINHSISIRFYILSSQWYRLPPKSQKILQLMTIRCNKPCQLIAGKILIMSVQSFTLTAQRALSYFMFMRSMQAQ